MPKEDRLQIIREIEKLRGSRVVTYLTADRGFASVPVAEDIVRIIFRHLQSIAQSPKLDLFLYSRGGDTMVPWPLVSAVRQHTKEFNVLVPYRAHSAATQIALGADHIVMGPVAELTQVDPSIRTEYTPTNPLNPQPGQNLLLSVEDLRAYFEFLKDIVGLPKEQVRIELELLKEKVHPIAIGQVHRTAASIEYITKSLLKTHIKNEDEVKKLAKAIVTGLHVHSHKINRKEAEGLGLPAVDATPQEADLMWKLYERYEEDMQLEKPIRPSNVFPNNTAAFVELKDQKMVYVESTHRSDVYLMSLLAARAAAQQVGMAYPTGLPVPQPAQPTRTIWGPQVAFAIEGESWSTE